MSLISILIDRMKASEMVEVHLHNGAIICGKFVEAIENSFTISENDNTLTCIPYDNNISFIRMILKQTDDQEIYDKSTLEAVKEKFRHNTSFSPNQSNIYRPRIQFGDDE